MDMKFSRVLLAFLCLTAAVHAEYMLQVDVESFSNPNNLDHDGGCCEFEPSPCTSLCDYYFLFCLQPVNYAFSFCPLGAINTQDGGTITGQTLNFGSTILGHPNPLTFTNTGQWPGSFQLMTRVSDADPDGDDIIDEFRAVVMSLSISDQFTGSMTYQGLNQPTITMTFRFKAMCATNFFGPDCTQFCQGRDDSSGHYTCDANGNEVCLDGYVDPGSNCVTPECAEGCDPIGGFCDIPGECQCNMGWSGDLCDTCIPATGCVNGYCNTPGECICNDGFSGSLCQNDEDVCSHQSPCQNGATCTSTGADEYECACAAGYTGVNCQDDIDDCAPSPCLNGGSCEDQLNGFMCSCNTGWEGLTCGDNIDECLTSDPCLNGGTCTDCAPTTPSLGGPGDPGTGDDCPIGYICNCSTGFFGDMCEGDIDYCMSDPCQNRATCHDQQTDYRCACVPGFTGINCETEVDECDPNPCLNGGTCEDRLANYTCDCAPGFTGRDCAQNIDDCPGNACVASNTQRCEDGINSYTCVCHPGFTGEFCEDDIDDCDPSPCLEGSTCVDLVNDFLCECTPGFTGLLCSVNINDCVSPDLCLNSGTCIDSIEDYICDCVPGFTGQQCETTLPPPCESTPCGDNEFCVDMGPAEFSCQVCQPGVGGVCVAPSPSPSPEPQGGDENIGVIIGVVVGGIVGAILLILLLCCCCFVLAPWYKRDKVEEHETTIGYDTMQAVGNQNPIYFGPNTLVSSRGSTLSSQGGDSLNRRSVQVQNPMYALPHTGNGNPPLPPRNGSLSAPLPPTNSSNHHDYDTIPALQEGGAPQMSTFGHGYARLESVNSREGTPQGTPAMALSSGKYDQLKDSKEGLPLLSANGSDSPLSARGYRATENPYVAGPRATENPYVTSPLTHSMSQTDPLDSKDEKLDKQEVLSVPQPKSSSSENPYVAYPK